MSKFYQYFKVYKLKVYMHFAIYFTYKLYLVEEFLVTSIFAPEVDEHHYF